MSIDAFLAHLVRPLATTSSVDLGVGVVAKLSSTVSAYLGADYNANLDTNTLEGVSGNLGLRMDW